MSLNFPLNINDLAPMNSFLYSTVDKAMLIEFSSLEQTKVSNYFDSQKTGLVVEPLRFAPRYFFRYTLLYTYAYTRLFREVEQHVANSPIDILMDLERAALNSVYQVYPNA